MKPSKFAGHPPRPTKGTLTTLATKQVSKDDGRIGEIPAKVVEVITAADVATLADTVIVTEQPKAQEESTVSTAPAPQAEVTPAPAAKPKDTGLYKIGKKYAPKTDRNSATWGKLVKALADGPKSLKDLTEEIKDHKDFLGYMTRGGHIVPHVMAEEAKA